jgi:hypothetical protein
MGQVERQAEERKAGRRTRAAGADGGKEWRGFVDCDLSQADKDGIRALLQDFPDAWAWLMGMVFEGYKMSLSYDHNNSSYVLALTCWRASDKNNGLTLTARGGKLESAVVSIWYKDTVMLKGAWGRGVPGGGRVYKEDDVG